MNCQDFHEIIDSYLSDELLTETNHEVLRHLEACAACRKILESRRYVRGHLRSAVLNCSQYEISADFSNALDKKLKRIALTTDSSGKKASSKFMLRLAAAAAVVLFAFGLSFWFLFGQSSGSSTAAVAPAAAESAPKTSLADYAVGDHQNCAVKYSLDEAPIEINLATPQYAKLRQAILTPLQSTPNKYKFLESHICKYRGHLFTHIVFNHQDKMVSVLLTDLRNHEALMPEEIARYIINNYQTARFDVGDRAVFVVSDLSESENFKTAVLLENFIKSETAFERTTESFSTQSGSATIFRTSFSKH